MIYFIGAISLISLVINSLIYRRITATYVLGTVEELDPAIYKCSCEDILKYLESQSQKEEVHDPVSLDPMVSREVYSAWKNEKDIPWVPPVKAPEPIVKPPNRGPLARPDGFI